MNLLPPHRRPVRMIDLARRLDTLHDSLTPPVEKEKSTLRLAFDALWLAALAYALAVATFAL